MPRTLHMVKTRPGRIGLCVLGVVMVLACHRPRSEGYRRIELFSAGHRQIEFVCLIGSHFPDTFVGTTPWQIELDLDTIAECICGTQCWIVKTSAGTDRMWMWGFDRESLRLDKYVATTSDRIYFQMRGWHCYEGKP